jgi:hypothetical protein
LIRAAERGDNLGAITALLLRLLDQYGAGEMRSPPPSSPRSACAC